LPVFSSTRIRSSPASRSQAITSGAQSGEDALADAEARILAD
jgi:hypothetical protein